MWDYLKLLDLRVENAVQAAYNYVWDRWGIMLGTVRWLPLWLGFLAVVVLPSGSSDPAPIQVEAAPVLWGVMAVVLILGVACILFVSLVDAIGLNILQREGFYLTINAEAQRYDQSWRFRQLGFAMIVIAVGLLFFGNWITCLCIMVGNLQAYTMPLKVRERDEERFKQHDLAMQGSM